LNFLKNLQNLCRKYDSTIEGYSIEDLYEEGLEVVHNLIKKGYDVQEDRAYICASVRNRFVDIFRKENAAKRGKAKNVRLNNVEDPTSFSTRTQSTVLETVESNETISIFEDSLTEDERMLYNEVSKPSRKTFLLWRYHNAKSKRWKFVCKDCNWELKWFIDWLLNPISCKEATLYVSNSKLDVFADCPKCKQHIRWSGGRTSKRVPNSVLCESLRWNNSKLVAVMATLQSKALYYL
jgi:DNA-directed RNA polymerase specialized sigma24 family protein